MHILTVAFSLLLIDIQVNGFNFGVRTNGFLNNFKSIFQKNIAGAVVSAGVLTTIIPHPGALADDRYAAESLQKVFNDVQTPLPAIPAKKKGLIAVDGEIARIFQKALQCQSDGELKEAQDYFEQVIEVEPDYIYGWSNLGNVLTSRGNLDQALLCYKKAISLYPPREPLASIILNKASIEMSIGMTAEAIKDLAAAEKLAGPQPSILTTKAVALTNDGRWQDAATIFEKVISTADRNALPWWLRYSQALLEINRGTEAVGFFQRTLNRFPDEAEAKAYGAALYTSLGLPQEGSRYWKSMIPQDRRMYLQSGFVTGKLKWGPIAIKNWEIFQQSKYATIENNAAVPLMSDNDRKMPVPAPAPDNLPQTISPNFPSI
mmetsp:Transcript_7771/g.7845  ORF Transcript_7771/g.7845 Transcript_7771/m.7845 type:complete len:376 (+) Transcript_7771:151-1278(+)